ncbi:MAG: dienelactone hydrolase family protein [Hyphomonas sp.]|jgi:dienelactone hydrolase|nr:dienelactone hydrolase family protein [Hyphomonas sp.]
MSVVDYQIDGQAYEGWFVKPAGKANPPLVIICHAWAGIGDNEKQKAQIIADEFGYAAFAIDVYGKGKRGTTQAENEGLMYPLVGNRAELQKRLAGGIAAAKSQSGIDASKAAAIGFCFGGLCVLDMARAGMDVLGVGSFHGLFRPAENIPKPKIKAKVLIEHGWNDPMATPDDVLAIAKEFAGADWQLHAHGLAVHAFTTVGATGDATQYHADTDRRSFAYLKIFLAELFG